MVSDFIPVSQTYRFNQIEVLEIPTDTSGMMSEDNPTEMPGSFFPGINSHAQFSHCFDTDNSASSTPENVSPMMGRIRRSSSRFSSCSYPDVTETVEIRGEATLCFDEEGTRFQGVIVTNDSMDSSHYSIQGKKTPRRKESSGPSSCGCVDASGDDTDESGVPVSFDIRIMDHDNPMEYHLRRVHGRNGQVCKFTCSNVQFTSTQVYRGHKADMIAQQSLGHMIEGGRSQVYCGPISVTVEAREEPRHWVL